MPFPSHDRPLADPFGAAADRARPLGLCSNDMPESLFTNHWDHNSLCSGFGCGECVPTPEDFGCSEGEDAVPHVDTPAPLGDGEEVPF